MTNDSWICSRDHKVSTKKNYSKTLTKAVSQNINVTEADI